MNISLKVMTATAALATVGLALTGCSSATSDKQSDNAGVTIAALEGEWVLDSGTDGSTEIVPVEPITLIIDSDGAVSGSGGCNNLIGQVEVGEQGAVTFGPLGRTQMFCEETMAVEDAYVAAFEKVDHAQVSGKQLDLTGTDVELTYTKK